MIKLLQFGKKALFIFAFYTLHLQAFAAVEPVPTGSFIVNMGVVPQTYANGIKPWGMLHDLIKNYRVQVKWVISQTKTKDGIDFTYNSTDFKGGTFIILAKYRTAAVNARITYWQSQGVVGITTTIPFNADVTYNLKYTPRWTFDFQNGSIALGFLDEAGISTADYPKKLPGELNICDDLFVMPHADPTWATHSNLLTWNQTNRGWIWGGCHATSVLENLINPLDSSKQMNFLSTNGLVMYGDHSDATPPYSYRFPNDGEMQFMGIADGAMQNGSEQIFLPKLGSSWRPTTRVAVYDPSQINVPGISPGEAGAILYGRAFGDYNRGEVMYTGGHNVNNGGSPATAAMRAFFNFSFLSVYDKAINPTIVGPINLVSLNTYTYQATLPVNSNAGNYTYHWISSCGGTFSNPFDTVTTFTAPLISSCTPCVIYCTVTDGCGREYYQAQDVSICPGLPPIALDRTMKIINNPNGTTAQTIGDPVPLAGTDEDGIVVNYVIKSLPANGLLFYDNDNNTTTADVAINALPGGELILTPQQMKTLKFDPADGFGSNTTFNYTVTDNSNLRDLTDATYTIPVNPPPDAISKVCAPVPSNAGITNVCQMMATDNGTITSYTITSLPPQSQCAVFVNDVAAYVGQKLTPSQTSSITYKPSGSYVGYAEIMFTATDNNGATDITAATLTLQMVNQPPSTNDLTSASITPILNTLYTLPGLSAVDNDGTIASYIIKSIPPAAEGVLLYNTGSTYVPAINNMMLTLTQAASLKFDPNESFTGVSNVLYTSKDNLGLVDNSADTLYIPLKVVPPIARDTVNVAKYAGAGPFALYGLTGNDPDSTPIISYYKIVERPSATQGVLCYGSSNIIINTDNYLLTPTEAANIKFVPVVTFKGTATFTFTVQDNEGLWDLSPATVSIPITNAAPVVANIINNAVANKGSTVDAALKPLQANDPENKIKSAVILTLPNVNTGILKLNTTPIVEGQVILPTDFSSLKFQTNPNNTDTATFMFNILDEGDLAASVPASFKIPIVAGGSSPIAYDATLPSINGLPVARQCMPLLGTDADGTVEFFTISSLTNISNYGTLYFQGVTVSAGQIIPYNKRDQLYFVPNGTNYGSTGFKYRCTDNDEFNSSTANQDINIINTKPVAQNINGADIKKGTNTKIISLSATDEDGTIVSYKILRLPTLGVLQCDVNNTNTYSAVSVNQVLTVAQAAQLRIASGNITGSTSFAYSALDNASLASDSVKFTFSVTASVVNQGPYVRNITSNAVPMSALPTLISPLKAIDIDGTITDYTIITVPPSFYGTLYYNSSGSIYDSIVIGSKPITLVQAATLKFRPSGIFAGNVAFTYTAGDNDGLTGLPATYTIPVTNADPIAIDFTNSGISSNAGPTTLQQLTATDDGTIENFIITTLPAANQGILVLDGSAVLYGQIIQSINIARLEFDPAATFSGIATFKFTVKDNFGAADKTPATISIPVLNFAPIADNKSSQIITNAMGTTAKSIPTLSGTDLDGSITTYTLKSLPTGGVLYVNALVATVNQILTPAQAALLSFDPNDNLSGTTSFTYTVTDNSGNVDATPALYQIFSNIPPVSYDIVNTNIAASPVKTNLSALIGTDDGSVSSYAITILPSNKDGVLYLNNVPVTSYSQVDTLNAIQIAQLSFLPTTGFISTAFSYTVTDNLGIIDVTPAVYTLVKSSNAVVPVRLISFNGKRVDNNNVLSWSTASEINTKHFEIQKSADGINFLKLVNVAAKGNSVSINNYSMIDMLDDDVLLNKYYYRLKIVDNDNSFEYSNIVVITRNDNGFYKVTTYPNPFTDYIVLTYQASKAEKVTYRLLDFGDKKVLENSVKVIKGVNKINLSGLARLASGYYNLQLITDAGVITTTVIKL